MATNYTKRCVEILQKEVIEPFKKRIIFILIKSLEPALPHSHPHFKFHTWKNNLQNRIKYNAPPDPYQPIFIKPKQIKSKLRHEKDGLLYIERGGLGQIKNGEWDSKKYVEPVSEVATINYFIERHVKNKKLEKTERYQELKRKRKNDRKHKEQGFETIEEYINHYFCKYDSLYDEISKNGFKQKHKGSTLKRKNTYPKISDVLEVQITIDREGHMHLFSGHHRFGIARALDLEIPAHVVCRHKQWQEFRDKINDDGLPKDRKELRDHPDLQDILSRSHRDPHDLLQ